MKTKFLALILAITFVCALFAACTWANSADTTAETTAAETTTAPMSTLPPVSTLPEETSTAPESTTAPATTIPPETTTAPATTAAPETTTAPVTTAAPETTTSPVTTVAPESTTAPATTVAPETTTAPVSTTAAPESTTAPATTVAPETTTAPVTTVAPETTTSAPVTTTAPETTTAAPVLSYRPVNDMMDKTSDELITYFAKPSSAGGKSDGFVFVWKDEVYVIDGGNTENSAGSTYMYLYTLRSSILEANGISATNTNYKLRINLIVSHFHSDHMNALTNYVIPSPYFAVDNLWCTAKSAFISSPYFNDSTVCNKNKYGEYTRRPALMSALERYQPDAVIHELAFGTKQVITTSDGKVRFTLYAPSEDYGAGNINDSTKGVGLIAAMYYKYVNNNGTVTASPSIADGLPTALINANSLWVKVECGSRSMLFTGDVMKKKSNSYTYGEPFDRMLSYYGYAEFDVDLVKFPHHGESRDAATNGVVNVIKPAIMVFTVSTQTISSQTSSYWKSYTGVWYDTSRGLTVKTNGTYMKVSTDGVTYNTVIK